MMYEGPKERLREHHLQVQEGKFLVVLRWVFSDKDGHVSLLFRLPKDHHTRFPLNIWADLQTFRVQIFLAGLHEVILHYGVERQDIVRYHRHLMYIQIHQIARCKGI